MTKQEQIEKIQEIINDCYVVDSYIAAEGSEGGYIDTEEAAKAIIEAGYGDISEYRAEIERLKAENKSQERENGFLKYCQCLTHGVDGSNHIKRAKIDVLNEVKERAVGLTAIETYHICNLIDELIKEVQNAENKS